ncbi:unnamed protein product [Rotaria socialis]|uniref:SEC7 domain-containing protein n=1 Tax=Rotaria socialis TaxID=392032 RepID=A0A818RR61_9BILA|nr:unnamed protein product [Rotaria socialis]
MSDMSPHESDGALIFVHSALERFVSRDARKVSKLKETAELAQKILKDHNDAVDEQTMGKVLETLNIAANSRNIALVTAALDTLSKLIAYGCLRSEKECESAVEMVCQSDSQDERIQLQVLKALVAAITAPDHAVHGSVLLKAVRCCWNIFLAAKTPSVAQVSLTQIIESVYARAIQPQSIPLPPSQPSSPQLNICAHDAYYLFRVFCKLSTRAVNEFSDMKATSITSRALSLQFIRTALETYPTLFNLQIDDPTAESTCFLQAVKTELASAVARALASPEELVYGVGLEIFLLFFDYRRSLRYEIEVVANEVLLSVLEMKSADIQQKAAIVRALTRLIDQRTIVEMYMNYDCNPDAIDNLYERMVRVLGKLACTIELSGVALIALAKIVASLDEWVNVSVPTPVIVASPQEEIAVALESTKHKKTLLTEAIAEFNKKPKRGIKLLTNLMPKNEIARFLLTTEGLNKVMIGEYLGDADEESVAVMHQFVDLLDFSEKKFVEAIRYFLQKFRLPGESQKIDRMLLKFAERYFVCTSGRGIPFASATAAYVLSYSVIMLNIDQHSPHVPERMTKEAFIKNNKGINEQSDLPEDVLGEIYDEIKLEEIKLKDDPLALMRKEQIVQMAAAKRTVREVFANALDELVAKVDVCLKKHSNVMWIATGHGSHAKNMFELVWMGILAAFSTALQQFDETFHTLDGFRHSIALSCALDLELQRTAFITCLRKFTFDSVHHKNIEAIKVLLECAYSHGNQFGRNWVEVLRCISEIEKPTLNGQYAQPIAKAIDKIFTSSAMLDGTAIVDFVAALCTVSREELPRIYSLKKIVEIITYNMNRIRVEWVNLWAIASAHINEVGCDDDETVATFALDSMRQLGLKFVEKEELANFKFQREFLKVFEYIVENNDSVNIREFIVRSMNQLAMARHSNLRSGWKSILNVFCFIGHLNNLPLFTFAFEQLRNVFTFHDEILSKGFLVDCLSCLLTFAKNKSSPKISLQSIDLFCKFKCQDLIYLKTLVEATKSCDLEARSRALQFIFEHIKQSNYNTETWNIIMDEVILELFSPLYVIPAPEEMNVWFSTTLTQAIKLFISLYIDLNLSFLFPKVLDILKNCIVRENEMLSQLGCSSLTLLVKSTANLMQNEWKLVAEFISILFKLTTPTILFDASILIDSPTRPHLFARILLFCILQLMLVRTVFELISDSTVFDLMPPDEMCLFVDSLRNSFNFAKKFNSSLDLRNELWKINFTKQLPNLLQQETNSATTLIYMMYSLHAKSKLPDGLIPLMIEFSTDVLLEYPQCKEETKSAYDAIVGNLLKNLMTLNQCQFEFIVKSIYRHIAGIICVSPKSVRKDLLLVLSRASCLLEN